VWGLRFSWQRCWCLSSGFWRRVGSPVDAIVFGGIHCLQSQHWRWWQYVCPKRWHLPTRLHGIKTQKIIVKIWRYRKQRVWLPQATENSRCSLLTASPTHVWHIDMCYNVIGYVFCSWRERNKMFRDKLLLKHIYTNTQRVWIRVKHLVLVALRLSS
jgi:hypothetical protein